MHLLLPALRPRRAERRFQAICGRPIIGATWTSLQPCVVQISGGEPLLRDDLAEIVRNVKTKGGLPYLILVSIVVAS